MKNEDLYNNISDICIEYLEEAEQYHSARKIHWHHWIAAAACFVLLLFAALPLLPGKEAASPFVITAYAVDSDGEITGTSMELYEHAPMTKITLSDGSGGFLFSVNLADKKAESHVYDISLGTNAQRNIFELYSIIVRTGKDYFLYVPEENEDTDGSTMSVTVSSAKTDGAVESYRLLIVKEGGEYTAQLMDVTVYPSGSIGGADGPMSVEIKGSN